MTKLEVGGYVDGWCTRCRLVLRHTIEAIARGKITRVHCNTCGGQHTHRPAAPRAPGAGGGSSARGARRAEPVAPPNAYHALLRGRTKEASRPYSTSERFAVGDLVAHAAFGLGVVTGERDANKIDIVFPAGPKVLLQGR
ncbi:MAG TPA: hypothetical protein VGK30_15875 [Candidatus Binatia bacterium]|jgi:hypothetical protein